MSAAPASTDRSQPSPLTMGDLAAAEGHWSRAITLWATSTEGPERLEAERRIRWFLAESPRPGDEMRIGMRRRKTSLFLLLAGCGLALLGTGIILYGEGRTGAIQGVVSLSAWICYIGAAALAVVWAWHVGRPPRPLIDADLALALDLAATLDASAQGEARDPA